MHHSRKKKFANESQKDTIYSTAVLSSGIMRSYGCASAQRDPVYSSKLSKSGLAYSARLGGALAWLADSVCYPNKNVQIRSISQMKSKV